MAKLNAELADAWSKFDAASIRRAQTYGNELLVREAIGRTREFEAKLEKIESDNAAMLRRWSEELADIRPSGTLTSAEIADAKRRLESGVDNPKELNALLLQKSHDFAAEIRSMLERLLTMRGTYSVVGEVLTVEDPADAVALTESERRIETISKEIDDVAENLRKFVRR